MSGNQLLVNKRQVKPGVWVLELSGFIGKNTEVVLIEINAHLDLGQTRQIAFDFSAVNGMDGSGLQSLVLFLTQFLNAKCQLTAFGVSPALHQVFALTGLGKFFQVFPDEQEALLSHTLAEAAPVHEPALAEHAPMEGWAKPVRLPDCSGLPAAGLRFNVEGRQPLPPAEGFGALWQRTYRVPLGKLTHSTAEVTAIWKERFSQFWPAGNQLITSSGGISPGAVAVIHLTLPGGLRLATGALVMHSAAESFSLMTLSGHMFCGWITFSVFEEDQLYAQTQALVRPGDLLFDLSFRSGFGAHAEDRFWHATLANLADFFREDDGVAEVTQHNLLVQSRVQWHRFGNLWYNAGVRSLFYRVASPSQGSGR